MAWFARQEGAVRAQLLDVYTGAFAEMREVLKANERDSYSRRHAQAIEAQLGVVIKEMERGHGAALSLAARKAFEAQLHYEQRVWTRLEETFGDPQIAQQFANFLPVINQRAVKALILTQGIPLKGFADDLTRDVRAAVGRSLLAGEGTFKTMARLQHIEDTPANPAQLHLISRMEVARATNEAKSDFIDQVNEEYPELQLWQIVRDRVDKKPDTRNHWFSWAISGTVRNVTQGEFFEVTAADLALARTEYHRITRKKAYDSGILWPLTPKGRHGTALPAHYNDRGLIQGWRPAWGLQFGPVKHPQGPIPGLSSEAPELSPVNPPKAASKKGQKKPVSGHGPRASLRGRPAEEARASLAQFSDERESIAKIDAEQLSAYLEVKKLKKRHAAPNIINEAIRKNNRLVRELEAAENALQKKTFPLIKSAEPGQAKIGFFLQQNPNDPNDFEAMPSRPAFERKIQKGLDAFNELIGPGLLDGKAISFLRMPGRAGKLQDLPIVRLSDSVKTHTLVHELAHWMEDERPELFKTMKEFWERRTAGDDFEDISTLIPHGLGDNMKGEYAKKDQWISPYMGKVYFQKGKNLTTRPVPGAKFAATELLSMGLEYMWKDPVQLALRDPEYFDLLWGIIHGIS